jgi:stalled ribosome rescue protein Dom34
MDSIVVWMDSEKATVFKFSEKGNEKLSLKNHYHDHHTHSPADGPKQMESFFHEIIEKIKAAEEILLTGPGLAKNHFKTHLESHHHQEINKKIVGVETSDHPSDNQLQAFGKKFFKKVHLFAGS